MNDAPSGAAERRRYRRAVLGMPVTAIRRNVHENDPRRVLGLHVMNVSRGGLSAIVRESVQDKEELTLFLPPLGPGMGQDAAAQVVRCVPLSDHYELGIAFHKPLPDQEETREPWD